jgi:hypothetical protein
MSISEVPAWQLSSWLSGLRTSKPRTIMPPWAHGATTAATTYAHGGGDGAKTALAVMPSMNIEAVELPSVSRAARVSTALAHSGIHEHLLSAVAAVLHWPSSVELHPLGFVAKLMAREPHVEALLSTEDCTARLSRIRNLATRLLRVRTRLLRVVSTSDGTWTRRFVGQR